MRRIYTRDEAIIDLDATTFYTHFDNKISRITTPMREIRYTNLEGFSVSQGVSVISMP